MANNLDYGANVSDLISPRVPFNVSVMPSKEGPLPPGDYRFRDFKPGKGSLPVVVQDTKVRNKNFMRPPVSRYEQDYISPEDSAVKRKNEKEAIINLAKQIYKDEENRRMNCEAARKIIESPTNHEEADVARAEKILSRGAPLTKEQCLEKAAKQFYGLRS